MSDEGTLDRRGIDVRTVAALGERVAVVETQQRALKDDTGIIRSSIHAINQDLQKVFITTQRTETQLSQLLGMTADLPSIAETTRKFAAMKSDIDGVIAKAQETRGAMRALGLVGTALMMAITAGGAGVTILLYLFGHLK